MLSDGAFCFDFVVFVCTRTVVPTRRKRKKNSNKRSLFMYVCVCAHACRHIYISSRKIMQHSSCSTLLAVLSSHFRSLTAFLLSSAIKYQSQQYKWKTELRSSSCRRKLQFHSTIQRREQYAIEHTQANTRMNGDGEMSQHRCLCLRSLYVDRRTRNGKVKIHNFWNGVLCA